jgi:glycosyltransferase involved in cell wall biosynthesis
MAIKGFCGSARVLSRQRFLLRLGTCAGGRLAVQQKTDRTCRFAVIDKNRNADVSITAIIPLYNGAKFIELAIRSVLSQTLQPDELIVVDDGSTDEGPSTVERLANENPLIRLLHKPNSGQSSARNFGVRHSKSNLIALLDQDDVWYPHHLERLSGPFRKRPGIRLGWVWSDLDEVDQTGGLVSRRLLRRLGRNQPKTTLEQCLKENMFILPSASLIDREAFEKVMGFDEKLSGYEDDDFFLRLFWAGYENIFLDEPLSQWRIHRSSSSHTARMGISGIAYSQKLLDNFHDVEAFHGDFVRKCIAPRFVKTMLAEYYRAVNRKDFATAELAIDSIAALMPYLRWQTRIILWPLTSLHSLKILRLTAAAVPQDRLRALGRLVFH